MTRASPRYYAADEIVPTPPPTRRGRPPTSTPAALNAVGPGAATHYILLGGPYPSRARAVAEHPDAKRILTAYEYDAARHRGLITWPDGSIPPEAPNPQVPQWRYALEVGDPSSPYPDERADRVYRFNSQDGRASWLRSGVPMAGLPGSRIPLTPNDPRVVAVREQVAAGEATWPDPAATLFVRRTANLARESERRRSRS